MACLSLQVGARLISHAGRLTNLAKYPASTVQILGVEKALFRYWGAPSLLGQLVAAVMAGLEPIRVTGGGVKVFTC